MLEPSSSQCPYRLPAEGCGFPAAQSHEPEALRDLLDYPPPPAIDGRQLQPDPVANQHPDEVPVLPIGNVRRDQRPAIQLHPVQRTGQLLDDESDYFRAATGSSLAVRIHGPSAVTATVCSKCADKL